MDHHPHYVESKIIIRGKSDSIVHEKLLEYSDKNAQLRYM